MLTDKQKERQNYRNNGRYSSVNPCQFCGKSSGIDFLSDKRTDTTINNIHVGDAAIMLCKKCFRLLDSMDDDVFISSIFNRK